MSSRASSFGRRAAEYDCVRPEYSPRAIDLAAERLGLCPESEVLDLGAGTGKLTRPLVERFARVTAVEPDTSMLAVLSQATRCYLALEGTAEAIPLADGSVDAVFVGQAFHWFDRDAALSEIARVLRPRGGLALLGSTWWNTEPPVSAAALELMKSARDRPGLERHALEEEDWKPSFDASPFEPLRDEKAEPEVVELDAESLVTLYLSTSVMGTLPPGEFEAMETKLRELIVGDYRLPVETELSWTRLSG